MTGQPSQTEWIDHSPWPGPHEKDFSFEDLKFAMQGFVEALYVSSRTFGKLTSQLNEVEIEGIRPHFVVCDEIDNKPDPKQAALDRKKRPGQHGPRPARQFDNRGRRRF